MITPLTRAAVALAVLAGAFGATPTRAADVYDLSTSGQTPLSNAGGLNNGVQVLNIILPAGRWVVSAKVSPVNFGSYDIDRCAIELYGVIIDGSSTVTGGASNYPLVATMQMQTAITLKASAPVGLWCFHDNAVSGQYLDPFASLLITPAVGPIVK